MRGNGVLKLDITVLDKEGHTVILVEVKARSLEDEDYRQITSSVQQLVEPVPFVMTADPQKIQLFQWDGKQLSGPLSSFETSYVLGHYEPEFNHIRIYENYLVTLLEAWLRDLAYHWKSESPPGTAELRRLGVLDRIEGGSTLSRAGVGSGRLRGVH